MSLFDGLFDSTSRFYSNDRPLVQKHIEINEQTGGAMVDTISVRLFPNSRFVANGIGVQVDRDHVRRNARLGFFSTVYTRDGLKIKYTGKNIPYNDPYQQCAEIKNALKKFGFEEEEYVKSLCGFVP